MKKSFAFPIVFMAILTAVFTFILSFLNYSTADQVEFNENNDLRQKILYVFDIDAPLDNPEEVAEIFEDRIEETEKEDGDIIYTAKENGETMGYAFPVRGSGLWGSILGYVAITEDYSEILGVDFISHSETPGLGGRIDEEEYKGQFRGLELDNDGGDYVIYNPATGGNADAISGATLTSKSVSDILSEDIREFIDNKEVE